MDNENIVLKYAKKIFGFAYAKTHNSYDAEDLSQEILLQILNKKTDFSDVENMDAYIYRICCYTWSNYLRKNKPEWNMINCSEEIISSIPSDENIEQDLIDRNLFDKLRQEIMYLSRTRRDITIMYYYENKSGDEIAKILGIPSSTVRWHMSETKTILKERIEMTDTNMIYKPVRLNVGINGQGDCRDMNGLTSDLIMQNICVICRENPLSIEEIARTLGISTFYLDEKIEKLLYMDFIRQVGSNKYQTNFFIEDAEYQLANLKFSYENVMSIALPLYNIAKSILPGYRASGLLEGEFSDNSLMYSLLMQLALDCYNDIEARADKITGLSWTYPRRKDGSRYFVAADIRWRSKLDEYVSDEDFKKFCCNGGGNGVSTVDIVTAHSLQYYMKIFGGWRDFESDDLKKLTRVYWIIKNNEAPNDFDKEIIAHLCELGYVRVENGKPMILVPIIRRGAQLENLKKQLETQFDELGSKLEAEKNNYVELVVKQRRSIEKLLPHYLDKNEKNFHISTCCGFTVYHVIYMLLKNGYLKMPSEDEKKSICTLVYIK